MTHRTLVTAVAATAVLALAAPAAHADTESFSDPRGDAERLSMSAESTADVVRTVGRYDGGRMTVAVTVADLTATEASMGARLRTSGRETFYAVRGRNGADGYAVLLDDDFQTLPCEGVTGAVQDERDRLVVSVPRACLGRPDWIRFGAATNARGGGQALWADDARRRGLSPDGSVTLGERRLRHG